MSKFVNISIVMAVLFTLIVSLPGRAQDNQPAKPGAEAEKAEDKKPADAGAKAGKAETKTASACATRQALDVTVALKGRFVASQTSEVILRPKSSVPMKVSKAVAHGTRVSKGDPILWLDPKPLNDQIDDLQVGRELARLTLQEAELDLATLEKTVPWDLAKAKRAKTYAEEDLLDYVKVERPYMEQQAERMVESAEFSLEYAEEELKQLEKMYKADDLTEETEEIILKRTRRQVESARRFLERAKIHAKRTLQVQIPRSSLSQGESLRRTVLSTKNAETALPNSLRKQRLELEKLKRAQAKSDKTLRDLRADTKLLTVKAPVDGVVFYGAAVDGQWSTASTVAQKLRPGGTLVANEVVMTVANPKKLHVAAAAEEKQLNDLKKGLPVRVTPVAANKLTLDGKVQSVAGILGLKGKFPVNIQLTTDCPKLITPGMSCETKVIAYSKKDALVIPEKALVTEGEKHFVRLVADDGSTQKRPVTTGRRSGGKVEILKGLKEGDRVAVTPATSKAVAPDTSKKDK